MSIGRSMRRVEDEDLLVGRAPFTDDLEVAREAAHLVLVRSPFAHAAVRLGSPPAGVLTIVAEDVPELTWPHLLPGPPLRRPLASDRTRFVGEAVAAIVSDDPRRGQDLASEFDVDFEPLEASTTVERALQSGAPLVYEDMGTNVAYHDESESDPRLFSDADLVIERKFRQHRIAPAMMECRAILAVPDGSGGLVVYVSHQNAHKFHGELVRSFGLAPQQIRVIVPNVGGAFGAKGPLYGEYLLAAWAALQTGRPVKFIESRSENLLLTVHGRSQTQRVQAGVTRDGRITALRAEIDGELGAALDSQRWCLGSTRVMLSGAYRIPRIEWDVRGILTHTPPIGAFRGAGRPEAAYLIERMVDEIGRELDIDPSVVRRQNFIEPDAFPYRLPTGGTYDSGDYRKAFDLALDRLDYDSARAEQIGTDPSSRHLTGVGVAAYVEMSAIGHEYGAVELREDGSVFVRTGTSPHGQGHYTSWTQLVVAQLGVHPGDVTVVHGDTAVVPRGHGTFGSKSSSLGGSAVELAAQRVADELRRLAAEHLEVAPEDIVFANGAAEVVGSPGSGVPLATLAAAAGGKIGAEHDFEGTGQNHPYGTHVCTVRIDTETGEVSITNYVAIDDSGRLINPLIVEGQIHGGIMQGISHALAEEIRFDEHGQLLNGSLATYPLPTMAAAPVIDGHRTEARSPTNPLGVKGVGESGITGATAAVANAVYAALAPLGIDEDVLPMPFTKDKVWSAVAEARR
jgi:aerobic carbon-monoxide dehydrogenase large subunit